MKLTLSSFRFEADGGRRGGGHRTSTWATLRMGFRPEAEGVGHPQATLLIPLAKDRQQTFGEQETQARDHALVILREAVRLLETHSVAELDDLGEEAERRERERWTSESDPAA